MIMQPKQHQQPHSVAHEYSNSVQDEQKIVGEGWESEFGGLDWTGLDWTTGMEYWNGILVQK